jgi:hypothetical protein
MKIESEGKYTPYQTLLLEMLERAFRMKVNSWINPESDIAIPLFVSTFQTRLLYHHVITDEVLNKYSFEYAMRDASRIAGKDAELNTTKTASSYDVLIQGERFSLKTEASRGISNNFIHISKLRECAWLRYVENNREKLVSEIRRYVLPLFEGYDRALSLRIFRSKKLETIQYNLVEIPKGMFTAIGDLTSEDFVEMNEYHSTSATVYYKGVPAYSMKFDGSDEKITLTKIPLSLCVTHATFNIPILYTIYGSSIPPSQKRFTL